MDATFTFPRPQAPVPRPAPASKASGAPQLTRESNALRASVLDAALELGLVSNPLVADWMFDNSLPEEDEEVSLLFGSLYPHLFFGQSVQCFAVLSIPFRISSSLSLTPRLSGDLGCLAVTVVLDAKLRHCWFLTPSLRVPQAVISSIKA